jgi:hypothetical protein
MLNSPIVDTVKWEVPGILISLFLVSMWCEIWSLAEPLAKENIPCLYIPQAYKGNLSLLIYIYFLKKLRFE